MLYIMWYMNLCFTQKIMNVIITKKAVFDLISHLPLLLSMSVFDDLFPSQCISKS